MITTDESIITQIQNAQKELITDGYAMNIGELISMYKENELILNSGFQREFTWSLTQQSKFIESIFLGIPLPSILVYQNEEGYWEVVDGVQRLSTIFCFVGILHNEKGEVFAPTKLEKMGDIPILEGVSWADLPFNPVQLDFKRSKIDVKIIKYLSHKNAKLEVFQRLHSNR